MIDPRDNNREPDRSKWTVGDHFIAASKNGGAADGNLIVAHQSCNLRKGAKTPIEFSKSRGMTLLEMIRNTSVGDGED